MDERAPFGAADMARTLAWFYLAGGFLGLMSLMAPMHPEANVPGLVVNCAVALAAALFLFAVGGRLPRASIGLLLGLGSVVITTAVLADGHGSSVYSFFYVWVGVEAYYFLTRTQAVLHIAFMGACYGGALAITQPDPVALQRWTLTVGVTLVVGMLVASMRSASPPWWTASPAPPAPTSSRGCPTGVRSRSASGRCSPSPSGRDGRSA